MLGGQFILQALKRNAFRHKHGIEGSGCGDCMGAACCACCGLVQEEKESLIREGKGVGNGGVGGGYKVNEGMRYP